MLNINMNDVYNIINLCVPYLTGMGVVILIAVLVMIFCRKLKRPAKIIIRSQSGIAILLAVIVTANLICLGPMSTLLTLASGQGVLSESTSNESVEVSRIIAEEGITLLQNDGDLLPLEQGKINVFGWASTNPCYGGAGSGSLSDAYPFVSLLEGLNHAGIETNTELSAFYRDYRAERPEVTDWSQDWTLPEPAADTYSQELIDHSKSFSDTAMIVITRVGGETVELPSDMGEIENYDQHYNSNDYEDFPAGSSYLGLSRSESDMIDLVCENFENVVLVINAANVMRLDFVREHAQIKSVIWCPGMGQNGFNALGMIVAGEINPSGRTTDTWVTDIDATPNSNNFGNFQYTNMDEYADRTNENPFWKGVNNVSFVNYVEGIYVGYRYYETAYAEAQAGRYDFDYEQEVMYPFGSGISYTTFEQQIVNYEDNGNEVTLDIVVTNTGDVPGKDVVELYYTPPYYNGGIEKSAVNLIDFDKTDLLEPGQSQEFTFTVSWEDMASFDTHGTGSYVLEAGEYVLFAGANAHKAIDSVTFVLEETMTYDEDNPRSTDKVSATSLFQYAEGDITYLSRENGFANYSNATAAPNMELSEELKNTFVKSENYEPVNDENDEMPVTEADNGVELAELRGLDYDDPKWNELLDQMSVSDMRNLIALAGYQTLAIDSVGKVATVDCDGPAAVNNNFTGVGSVGLPSEVVIGASWSKEVALLYGQTMGKMADEMDVSGWYAPAVNIHRNPYGGRNFEYLSEDGILSGYLAAQAVIGAKEYGVYTYVKHFACNEQETNRQRMLCTFLTEQSLREIYLKPFEIAVKEGGTTAMMSSYNYIGTRWAGGTPELQTSVLRDEWGFRGFVLSDYWVGAGYMNADQAVRSGSDACLISYDSNSNYVKDTESATSIRAMRTSSHNIMYTVVNSRAYEEGNIHTGLYNWQIITIVIDVFCAAVIVMLELIAIRSYKKAKESELPYESIHQGTKKEGSK